MSLQSLFTKELATRDINEVAKQLGYNARSYEKVSARINTIINSPYLALDKSGFDFRYSTPELIRKLCAIFDIPAFLCNKIIGDIEEYLLLQQSKFKPYIFIETNFQRKGQPIFALAVLESTRYISLDSTLNNVSLNEILDPVKKLVKSHYQNQSEPLIWGKIEHYVFYYDEQTVIILSPTGKVLSADDHYNRSISRATLSLK